VELDCFVAVFVLEQELQKERERCGLIFWFFHFLQKEPDEGKREAVQHFLHIKKASNHG